jgi:tRNA(adenine34) deaminase
VADQHELDKAFMQRALELGQEAAGRGEIPVGAVVVLDGEVIGEGSNNPIGGCDPSAHAEILALRAASQQQSNYRLPGATLYVTIEPCTMCFGAMVHARIARLVYGASEPKAGVISSNLGLHEQPIYNHQIEIQAGMEEGACSELIKAFFAERRELKAQLKNPKSP